MINDLLFSSVYRTATAVLLLALAAILGALAFEHIGGYAPCSLCLEQRYAYYLAIPLLLLGLLFTALGRPIPAAMLFAAVAAAFLANAVLAGDYPGADWNFWPRHD